jgi:hypothetical protein
MKRLIGWLKSIHALHTWSKWATGPGWERVSISGRVVETHKTTIQTSACEVCGRSRIRELCG